MDVRPAIQVRQSALSVSQAAVWARTANHCSNGFLCRFEAELYALTKEEGGRHTPFFTKYRPQFFFRTADVTGAPRALDTVGIVNSGT